MDIFTAIAEGLHDDDLSSIIEACQKRESQIPLKVGDTVVVKNNCQPKYMQGVKGTIKSLTGKKQRGNPVYLVKVNEEEKWKLTGTKMVKYAYGEYKLADIHMARDLISKVTD